MKILETIKQFKEFKDIKTNIRAVCNVALILIVGLQISFVHASKDNYRSNKKYKMNFEFVTKYGDRRHEFKGFGSFGGGYSTRTYRAIAQAGLLTPILQKRNSLVYIPLFVMLDNKKSSEFNVGVGYRKIFNSSFIMGGYAFFDYRKSPLDNFFKQLTLGYELFTKSFEFRANIYLPESEKKLASSTTDPAIKVQYNGHFTEILRVNQTKEVFETAEKGFDVELGFTKPYYSVHFAYYSFLNRKRSTTHGTRVRASIRAGSYLQFEGEVSSDNKRDTTSYVGIRINFPKKINRKNTTLKSKMTSLPVRDIDIITEETTTHSEEILSTTRKSGLVVLIDPNRFSYHLDPGENSIYSTNVLYNYMDRNVVDDIAIIKDEQFVFLGELDYDHTIYPEGSPEHDTIKNIYKFYVKKDSRIYNCIESGLWSDKKHYDLYKERMKELTDRIKIFYPLVTPATDYDFNKFVLNQKDDDKGLMLGSIMHVLNRTFRKNYNVLVLNYYKETDTNTVLENQAEFERALTRAQLTTIGYDVTTNRYLALNWGEEKHATALVVDLQDKKTIWMESNGRKRNDKQKQILDKWYSSYEHIDYNPSVQRESWSCGLHTIDNLRGYINGYIKVGDQQFSRNYKALWKEFETEKRIYDIYNVYS